MKRKTVKLFVLEALGFPIQLSNVPMVELRGDFVPDIDYNKLQKAVLLHLSHKKMPLTGNEIQFIRKYFSMTAKAFGHLFGYTHSAVLKWENRGDHFARIAPTTEVYLRLYLLEYLRRKPSDFKELYNEISIPQLSHYLKRPETSDYIPILIDVRRELSAA
ncbi:MAG: hypothetical protein LLG04_05160 [Parachlamydia sp.]|nr:hypothetical protein [Parachlamydia sp.]